MPLIIFEGLDKCGKSTHSLLLVENLKKCNHSASLLRFPDRTTESGQKCDRYLRGIEKFDDLEINDIFALNRAEKYDYIVSALERNEYIICDRYTLSGIAYSSSKGYSIERCAKPDGDTLVPDLIFYCTSDQNTIRSGFGDEVYESFEKQKKVEVQFNKLLAQLENQVKIVTVNTDNTLTDNEALILSTALKTKTDKYRRFRDIKLQ